MFWAVAAILVSHAGVFLCGLLFGARIAFDQNRFLIETYNKHNFTSPSAECPVCEAPPGQPCDAGLHG